jgi:hypothetical protein
VALKNVAELAGKRVGVVRGNLQDTVISAAAIFLKPVLIAMSSSWLMMVVTNLTR